MTILTNIGLIFDKNIEHTHYMYVECTNPKFLNYVLLKVKKKEEAGRKENFEELICKSINK